MFTRLAAAHWHVKLLRGTEDCARMSRREYAQRLITVAPMIKNHATLCRRTVYDMYIDGKA